MVSEDPVPRLGDGMPTPADGIPLATCDLCDRMAYDTGRRVRHDGDDRVWQVAWCPWCRSTFECYEAPDRTVVVPVRTPGPVHDVRLDHERERFVLLHGTADLPDSASLHVVDLAGRPAVTCPLPDDGHHGLLAAAEGVAVVLRSEWRTTEDGEPWTRPTHVHVLDTGTGGVRWTRPVDAEPAVTLVDGVVALTWPRRAHAASVPEATVAYHDARTGEALEGVDPGTFAAGARTAAARRTVQMSDLDGLWADDPAFAAVAERVHRHLGLRPVERLKATRFGRHEAIDFWHRGDDGLAEHLLVLRDDEIVMNQALHTHRGHTSELVATGRPFSDPWRLGRWLVVPIDVDRYALLRVADGAPVDAGGSGGAA